jgi:hypothetical protein
MLSAVLLIVIMPNAVILKTSWRAECYHAQCCNRDNHYYDCKDADCHYAGCQFVLFC